MIGTGIGNYLLPGYGVEIAVPQLHRYAAGKPVLAAQFESRLLRHAHQRTMQEFHIDSISFKGAFGTHAFLLAVRNYRAIIHTLCAAPKFKAIFTQQILQVNGGYFAEGADGFHAHLSQQGARFIANHGHFFNGQRPQKNTLGTAGYLQGAAGLGFAGGYLTYEFIGTEAIANGQAALLHDVLPQFGYKFGAAKKAVHAGEVNIKLIDATLFIYRYAVGNNIGYHAAVMAVAIGIAANNEGMRAQSFRQFNSHTAAHPIAAGFVAAGGHHGAVAAATHNYGTAFEGCIFQHFHTYKKRIEIEVGNGAARRVGS